MIFFLNFFEDQIFKISFINRTLNLNENAITTFMPFEKVNGFVFTIFNLDLSGEKNGVVTVQDLKR